MKCWILHQLVALQKCLGNQITVAYENLEVYDRHESSFLRIFIVSKNGIESSLRALVEEI